MRAFLVLCCWLFAASLRAQSPAMGGIFTLLLGKPFVADVASVSTSTHGFELSLHSTDGGTSTYKSVNSGPSLEQPFVSQLKAGRRYAFPQCLVDFLGLDETVRIIRALPTSTGTFMTFKQTQSGLLDLGREHAFRATVLDSGIGETNYSIILQGANSQLYHASGTFSSDKVRVIAEKLKRGETYEFPAALDDGETRARPKSAAVAVLGRYIGAWSGTVKNDPKARVQMNCHWLSDGSGIWRELTFDHPGSDELPTLDIARITFDAGAKSYIIADPAAEGAMALSSRWNEDKRTFTTALPRGSNGQTRINTATFAAEDRIEWKTETREADGKVLATNRGSYTRTSKSVPPAKLPLPSAQSVAGALPSAGNQSFSSQTSHSILQTPNPTTTSQMPPAVIHSDFFKLRDEPPFRGKVTRIERKEGSLSATIERIDLRQISIHHTQDEQWDKAVLIAQRLTPGSIYEFPAVLADDFQPVPEGFMPQPSTDAMRALAPFIGEWSMHWSSGPGKDRPDKITLRYFWTNDGTGLWREIHLPAGMSTRNSTQVTAKPHVDATLTGYDPATQSYYEVHSTSLTPGEKHEAKWDAATQTYSLNKHATAGSDDLRYSGTRRIISRDRIDFQTKTIRADGSVLNESGGHYQRIEP